MSTFANSILLVVTGCLLYQLLQDPEVCLVPTDFGQLQRIVFWIVVNLVLNAIFRSYRKRQIASMHIISTLACLEFMFTRNLSALVAYYQYDLIVSFIVDDRLMMLHHVFTLYGIQHCSTFADWNAVWQILILMKSSDLLIHQYKITNALELEKRWPEFITRYQVFALTYTIITWMIYRVYYILRMMPFTTLKANIIIPIFVAFNLYWIHKQWSILLKVIDGYRMRTRAV